MVDSTNLPEVDINAIATDLNNKMDRDFTNSIGYDSARPFVFLGDNDNSNYMIAPGYITSDRTMWKFGLDLPKPINDNVTTITVNSLKVNIRTNLGKYSPAFVDEGTELIGLSEYTISVHKVIGNKIVIDIRLSTALDTTVASNNAPGMLQIIAMNLSFS